MPISNPTPSAVNSAGIKGKSLKLSTNACLSSALALQYCNAVLDSSHETDRLISLFD
jgi:hypothetical protein